MKPVARLIALLAGCGVFVAAANAQQYPSRAVKFLVPQAPAGATDVFARKVGQMLSEKWGQPVVVENRAGAAGVVGTDIVAKAPADGYTLLVTYAGSQAINPSLYANLPFDSIKAFQTVATVARTPFFLIANPRLPAKNLRDFVDLARGKPDAYTFASSGNGSVNHLLGEMLKAEAGIKILHVPYRGVAEAITDVLAGHVDTAFSSVPSVLAIVRGGQVRALAVSSAKRVAVAPEVPTIAESGYPGFDVDPWWESWRLPEPIWRLCARSMPTSVTCCRPRRWSISRHTRRRAIHHHARRVRGDPQVRRGNVGQSGQSRKRQNKLSLTCSSSRRTKTLLIAWCGGPIRRWWRASRDSPCPIFTKLSRSMSAMPRS